MDFIFQLLFSPLPTPVVISVIAVGVATLFYLNTRPSPLRSPADLNRQSLGVKWIIGELACYTYSMVAVPLYDTLGPEALVFIINQGNWSFTLLSNAANCRDGVSGGPCEDDGDWSGTHITICSQLPQGCSGLPGYKPLIPSVY
ncbi:hypothetical protein GOODEAATRI_012392 [Goodea atripinnis]|uniref:Uncharacterized protein n=1 Tax=Goodea atripinnis TaxID=208336 RepID=A0ABV0P3J0_9TELE